MSTNVFAHPTEKPTKENFVAINVISIIVRNKLKAIIDVVLDVVDYFLQYLFCFIYTGRLKSLDTQGILYANKHTALLF